MTAAEPVAIPSVRESIAGEIAQLERELSEIDLLVQQARTETTRHEARRAQAAERLAALESRVAPGAADERELAALLLTQTRRATLMQAQIDILEAKQKTLNRYLQRLRELGDQMDAAGDRPPDDGAGAPDALPPGLSRAVLAAQEDLRRDIARSMHDGPAQSLANIALQAEIVQRLMSRDAALANAEVGQLIRMVQHALEATKNFIFDVRPMVLDDLGLVPTLRRAARDRGRRASLPIEFDSVGADRRLPVEVESALFRIIDDALVAYLGTQPRGVSVRLDWGDEELRASVRVTPGESHAEPARPEPPSALPVATPSARPASGGRSAPGETEAEEVPPALAAMMHQQDRDDADVAAASAAARAEARSLPAAVWREIQSRAKTVGIALELLDGGQLLEARADLRG